MLKKTWKAFKQLQRELEREKQQAIRTINDHIRLKEEIIQKNTEELQLLKEQLSYHQ